MRIRLPAGSRTELADAVWLVGRLLDDLGRAGLQPLEDAVDVGRRQVDGAKVLLAIISAIVRRSANRPRDPSTRLRLRYRAR
jgi:hypothetical protein